MKQFLGHGRGHRVNQSRHAGSSFTRKVSDMAMWVFVGVILLAIIIYFGFSSSNETKFTFNATYQRPDRSSYVLTGTGNGSGNAQCPPFQNGGKDVLIDCKITK